MPHPNRPPRSSRCGSAYPAPRLDRATTLPGRRRSRARGGARLAAQPLYVELVAKTGQAPQWNFHKYLVDRSGKRVESFGSAVDPGVRPLVSAIARMLADKPAS